MLLYISCLAEDNASHILLLKQHLPLLDGWQLAIGQHVVRTTDQHSTCLKATAERAQAQDDNRELLQRTFGCASGDRSVSGIAIGKRTKLITISTANMTPRMVATRKPIATPLVCRTATAACGSR